MRRFGGFVLFAVLTVAACSTGGDVEVVRSTAPGHDGTIDVATGSVESAGPTTTGSPTDSVADADLLDAAVTAEAPRVPVADDPVPIGVSAARATPSSASAAAGPTPTGRIEIPAIGLSHQTYEGIALSTIDHGPSHWPGTARPGHAGNTVFPGHRTTHSRPFWDIDLLRAGDSVIFTTDEGRFTYRVTQTFVVDDTDTWIVDPTGDPTFTIFACHPKGSARQRYVVKGDLVSAPATTTTTSTTTTTTTTTAPPRGLLDGLFG